VAVKSLAAGNGAGVIDGSVKDLAEQAIWQNESCGKTSDVMEQRMWRSNGVSRMTTQKYSLLNRCTNRVLSFFIIPNQTVALIK
jgi:hypothetical protein